MSNDPPNLARLKKWGDAHGFVVSGSAGTQRDPENVVAVSLPDSHTTLLRRQSLDSVDTAALYLLNTLELLGVPLD